MTTPFTLTITLTKEQINAVSTLVERGIDDLEEVMGACPDEYSAEDTLSNKAEIEQARTAIGLLEATTIKATPETAKRSPLTSTDRHDSQKNQPENPA